MPTTIISAASPERLQLRALIRGDREAMILLYDQHAPVVMAVALRILSSRALAQSLVTDIFMELWNRPEDFDSSRSSLATAVISRCRTRALDRRRARELSTSAPVPSDPLPNPDPSARCARLAPSIRQVLDLAYFDGLDAHAIAQRLASPVETVLSMMRQGLLELRELSRGARAGGTPDTGSSGQACS